MRIFEKSGLAAAGKILPFEHFSLFSDVPLTSLADNTAKRLCENAENVLKKPFEILKATDYLRFYRDGDRVVYEKTYFERRHMVFTLLMGEFAEGKGRFTDKLAEGVWHILEETTWCVPAHMKTLNSKNYGLCDEYGNEVKNIDLFSASTGGVLAIVFHYGKHILDEVTPVISERILYELDRRIFTPFCENPSLRWTGEDGTRVNNWNPWIISNILTAASVCVTDLPRREGIADRAMRYLDNFTSGYAPDGGCDEGPNYWGVAGASYFDCLEILYDMSGGEIDIFHSPLVKNIMEYIMNAHISGKCFLPFADSHLRLNTNYPLIARSGAKIGSERLYAFGVQGLKKYDNPALNSSCPYRSLKELFCVFDKTTPYTPRKCVHFENLCVFAFREFESENEGLYLAVKGGNNDESHNHNDVGNFVIYADGEPLIIDVGVGTYCKDTFSENRYKIWTMQSSFHNLPEINGIQQQAGESYRVQNFVYDEARQTVSLNLTEAYPKEAGILSFIRTASLSDGAVTVRDEILLKEKGKIAFNIMLCEKPKEADGCKFALSMGRALHFSPDLSFKIEEIPLTDGDLKRDWERDALFRIILTDENIDKGTYTLTVE